MEYETLVIFPFTYHCIQIFVKLCESKYSTKDIIIDSYNKIIKEHKDLDTPIALFTSPFNFLETYNSSDYSSLRIDEQDVGAYELNLDRFSKAHPTETSIIE